MKIIFPNNFKSRLFPSGKLRQEIRKIKQLVRENPDSEFAKKIYKQLIYKFWFGSKRVSYIDLFEKAWSLLLPEYEHEIIEIGGLKFINDAAFKSEYSDIFIAGGVFIKENLDQNKKIANEVISLLSVEGPYENDIVKLRKDDIVIDAGANMGLFSLLCFKKGVEKVYAFEPQKSVLNILEKNLSLNNATTSIEIIPFGVSKETGKYELSHSYSGHSAASMIIKRNKENDNELIHCVSLDNWVAKNNISRIDFIKADIEGAEREMLQGAIGILRDFSPRLAICTYHLPDDPVILEKIILNANPSYRIVHTSHKLFAYTSKNKQF